MTYKDGTSFNSNRYMTTTDSLQVDYMYCQDMPQASFEKFSRTFKNFSKKIFNCEKNLKLRPV